MHPHLQEISQSILDGKMETAKTKVQQALEAGLKPAVILNEGLIAAMTKFGQLFEEGEYFVPEMLIAARTMQAGLSVLKPQLKQSDFITRAKVVIGTVKGDLHDIGKNLVAMMLEGAGFELVDLGTDVSSEQFVAAVRGLKPNLVGLSALLTTTILNMMLIIEALQSAGLRKQVKAMIGDAPITEEYARQIGADGYAPDASQAVILAKSLIAD